jgi:uncharacterized membrane protein
MKSFIIALTVFHVLIGTVALLVGLVPMFSRKGGALHRRTGLVYVWCMFGVAFTALLMCGLQEFRMLRLFLTGIAVLSFYLCITGWRATRQKKTGPTRADNYLTYGTLAVSAAMIGFGGWLLYVNGPTIFPILFSFFGALTFSIARKDYVIIGRPIQKQQWFFQHLIRMGGSYIATFTAFLVNNTARMLPADAPDWIFTSSWILPTIIGAAFIARAVIGYKRKFAASSLTAG